MTAATETGMPDWFATWFGSKFNLPVPDTLSEYLASHANGLWSPAGTLWKPEAIIDATEERDLQEKGVCVIGETAFEGIFLLRARDGRVFAVDKSEYGEVDAWFSDLDSCVCLLGFEEASAKSV
jgi:hypothetical protein